MNTLTFALLAASVPEQFEDATERFNSLIYDTIIPVIFGVLAAIFVVIGIIRATKIALADNEDTKKKAVKSMVWFLIGAVLCFLVAFLTPVIFNYLGSAGVFPNPSGN